MFRCSKIVFFYGLSCLPLISEQCRPINLQNHLDVAPFMINGLIYLFIYLFIYLYIRGFMKMGSNKSLPGLFVNVHLGF